MFCLGEDTKMLFQIRVTGVLIEGSKILIVQQNVSAHRSWSLPGGRLEAGETLEGGVVREIREETGLATRVVRLLYICDTKVLDPPLLHITFLLERIDGHLRLPSNEFDHNPINDVRMVDVRELVRYGFSSDFMTLAEAGFPDAGNYKGFKEAIGL